MTEPEPKSRNLGAIIRSGLNLIPICGGAVATGWSEWDTSRKFARIEEELAVIGNLLKNKTGFPLEALGDAEYQLLEEILRRVQTEHRAEKRASFAHLLAECWTVGVSESFERRMVFVRALDRFEELHVQVLKHLSGLPETQEHFPVPKEIACAIGIDEPAVIEVLNPVLDLLAREFAFVVRNWSLAGHESKILFTGNLGPENLVGKCGHKITSLGRQFLEYIGEAVGGA